MKIEFIETTKLFLSLILIIVISGCSSNQKVLGINNPNTAQQNGTTKQENDQQKAATENKASPIISNDGKFSVIIKNGNKTVDTESGYTNYNQLWLKDLTNGKENLLLSSGKISEIKIDNVTKDNFPFDQITDIASPVFSNDGHNIYFMTRAWVTSDAIFSINLNDDKIRFITDSNYLEVIKNGKYKDELITNHHRYFDGGGSYDYYYITNPITGKDVKMIGKELTNF